MTTRTLDWTLGDRLAKSLAYAGLTQGEMAARLGVTPKTIYNWVHDRVHPSRHALMAWAQVAGVDLDWLAGCTSVCQSTQLELFGLAA